MKMKIQATRHRIQFIKIIFNQVKQADVPGDSDSEAPDLIANGERLEDDEELRLHVLGYNSYYVKQLVWMMGGLCSLFFERLCHGVRCRYIATGGAEHLAQLPTRYLPPGNVKMLYYEFVQRYPSISWPDLDLIFYSDLEAGSVTTLTTHHWTNHRSGTQLSGGGIQAGGKTSFDFYHLRPTPHAIAALITSKASNIAKRLRWYNWMILELLKRHVSHPSFQRNLVRQGFAKPVWNSAQLQSTSGFCGSWPQPRRAATGLVACHFFCMSFWIVVLGLQGQSPLTDPSASLFCHMATRLNYIREVSCSLYVCI